MPRACGSEVTRPLELELRRRGPDAHDIAALERGEIESLCFADRYRIGPRIGKGGMAVVFRGEHLALGQPVAVKILVEREADRYQVMVRFLREARLGTRIRHENIVEVFDYGSTPEGLVYLVMELLEGEDLRALIGRHDGLPWTRARSLMLQICEGVAAVHEAGIVHRDLKPSNCFRVLTRDGEQIKLIDFGAASLALGDVDGHHEGDRDDTELDGPSTVVGTPQYMSPEQARGEAVDARSDIYAAGMILCELLTGRVPFTGRSPAFVLAAQIHESPATLQQLAPQGVRIDPAIQRIYERAVAKDPAERFGSIGELAAAVRAVEPAGPYEITGPFEPVPADLQPATAPVEPVPARRRSWWDVAAGFVAALGSLGAFAHWSH